MLKFFRAEHILAILFAGIFLLADAAVLCFFVSTSNDVDSHQIVRSTTSADHGYISTNVQTQRKITQSTLGGGAAVRTEAVEQLQKVISAKMQTMTQEKRPPKI